MGRMEVHDHSCQDWSHVPNKQTAQSMPSVLEETTMLPFYLSLHNRLRPHLPSWRTLKTFERHLQVPLEVSQALLHKPCSSPSKLMCLSRVSTQHSPCSELLKRALVSPYQICLQVSAAIFWWSLRCLQGPMPPPIRLHFLKHMSAILISTQVPWCTTPVAMEAQVVEEPQPEAEPDMEVTAQRERVEVTQALQAASAASDCGNFGEAQQVLERCDQRLKSKKQKTRMADTLGEEIADAQSRMQSRSLWEGSGRAEVRDAMQMHSMQRSTNMMVSSSAMCSKSSRCKAMYLNTSQADWVSRSKKG